MWWVWLVSVLSSYLAGERSSVHPMSDRSNVSSAFPPCEMSLAWGAGGVDRLPIETPVVAGGYRVRFTTRSGRVTGWVGSPVKVWASALEAEAAVAEWAQLTGGTYLVVRA